MTGFQNVRLFIREKVWLENSLRQWLRLFSHTTNTGEENPCLQLDSNPHSQQSRGSRTNEPMAQAIFEPNLFPFKYPNILKPRHLSYLPAYEDGTDRVFRNVGI